MEYTKVEEIGRGGFGVVSKVVIEGEEYALKEFDPGGRFPGDKVTKMKRRFEREAKVQSQIKHPNVLKIIEADLDNDPPKFLMPLAERDYWSQISKDRRRGEVSEEPLFQILSGLEELHRLGFVHRDLKPENVLEVDGRWVLSDLGLVMPRDRATSALTSTDSAWGTEDYAAPELTESFKNAPPQADIYSFGCIIHDLVNSNTRVPFNQHTSEGPLGPIIEKCTEINPQNRFDDVASLRSAISVSITQDEVSNPDIKPKLEKISERPSSVSREEWSSVIRFVEKNKNDDQADTILRAIDIIQIEALSRKGKSLLERLTPLICGWVKNNEFRFSYCDVLGARLLRMYNLGNVDIKAQTAMAAMSLSCSHNRWSVMRKFNEMADKSISQDVADRIAIEITYHGKDAVHKVQQINREIGSDIDQYHPRIRMAIEELRSEYFRDNKEAGPALHEGRRRPSILDEENFAPEDDLPFDSAVADEDTFEPDEDLPFDTSEDDETFEPDDDLPF